MRRWCWWKAVQGERPDFQAYLFSPPRPGGIETGEALKTPPENPGRLNLSPNQFVLSVIQCVLKCQLPLVCMAHHHHSPPGMYVPEDCHRVQRCLG